MEAYHIIARHHVEPVNESLMDEGTIQGMLTRLDGYGRHFTVSEFKRLDRITGGDWSEDKPAPAAEVEPVQRTEPVETALPLLHKQMLGSGIGLIRIESFTHRTLKQFEASLAALAEQPLNGLVIDLRYNVGGVLEAGIDLAGLFIDGDEILRVKTRSQYVQPNYIAPAGDVLKQAPIAVLVNRYTASSSELVAAALQSVERAAVFGETTTGKGSIQSVLLLSDGSAIKLTTGRFTTTNGKNINGIGVEPDYFVRQQDYQSSALVELRDPNTNHVNPAEDYPLFEAVDWLIRRRSS